MGRPPLLTDDRLDLIRRNATLPMSREDLARSVGVSSTAFFRWLARAREVVELVPREWDRLSLPRLRELAVELGVDLAAVRGSGAGGRVLRGDVVEHLRARVGRYVELWEALEQADHQARREALAMLDDLAKGRVRVKRTTTIVPAQAVKRPDGRLDFLPAAGEALIKTEERELPPDRQVLLKLAEYRGWLGAERAPQDTARDIYQALQDMMATVSGPEAAEEAT